MEILIVATAAFLAAGLTLFSGFGLGTLLMPIVAIFVPAEVAIGITLFANKRPHIVANWQGLQFGNR